MTLSGPRLWLMVGIVAALQTAALASIVWGRVSLLKTGREIVVEVIPVDPRDIFRGDYVVLGYAFSQAPLAAIEGKVERGDALYVMLREKADRHWEAAKASAAYPAAVEQGAAVLKGRVEYVWTAEGATAPEARIRYGIESYFVPEGTGRALEELVRDKKIFAVLAVGDDGTAAIKGLEVDGKRVYVEPAL